MRKNISQKNLQRLPMLESTIVPPELRSKRLEAWIERALQHPFFALPPPKSLDRNDFAALEMHDVSPADGAADPIAEALREAGERTAATPLDRGFYEWYWSLMMPAEAGS